MILVPQPGIEPASSALEGEFLTNGPRRKSPSYILSVIAPFPFCDILSPFEMCLKIVFSQQARDSSVTPTGGALPQYQDFLESITFYGYLFPSSKDISKTSCVLQNHIASTSTLSLHSVVQFRVNGSI